MNALQGYGTLVLNKGGYITEHKIEHSDYVTVADMPFSTVETY